MKILIHKINFLKNFVLDQQLEESTAIINAAKDYYSHYETIVQIEGDLISINLSGKQRPDDSDECLLVTDSIGILKLAKAIPILEKLIQNDPSNVDYFEDLFKAYEVRGDFDKIKEMGFNS